MTFGQVFSLLALVCCLRQGDAADTNLPTRFNVRAYAIEGSTIVSTNAVTSVFSKHTGENVGIEDIVQAAAALQGAYRESGYPAMCISIAPSQITNGIVTMHAYQGAYPQILVSGRCYLTSSNVAGVASASAVVNAPGTTNIVVRPPEPRFPVAAYEVSGNSLLSEATLQSIFTKHTGTNIGFGDISDAVKDLQLEYHNRGYDTVSVTIPQQRLTNAVFKIHVFEGRLAEVVVTGNRYFSSNNVVRSLPGLKTNMILNSKMFQPELDRANANQDRQVYPEIRPGPEPNTTSLFLRVKDRIPFHAKIEANNQSAPGTPENRINSSAVYNNLWQQDHSLGVQYSFSPEDFKDGNQWNFYDRPLVANYSAFYRLPLAAPSSMEETMASRPGNFGYSEATRRFELPPASGVPELNLYASRSTIDTGVESGSLQRLSTSISGDIDQESDHQDVTINEAIGFRLSEPLPALGTIHSRVQGGLDFKSYKISSFGTNNFVFTQFLLDTSGNPFTRVSTTPSPIPATTRLLSYLPLAVRWDANRPDKYGSIDFGINYAVNLWFSDGVSNLQSIANSPRASGHWHQVSASLARDQTIYGEWKLSLRADGQWASEPLISNEQFGVGGVGGVRGYREGEVFGSTGWRVTSEFRTPMYSLGNLGFGTARPVLLRASAFMDYAEAYQLDASSHSGSIPLWGTGFGLMASVGHNWDGRLLFAWPLLSTPASEARQLRISFSLKAEY